MRDLRAHDVDMLTVGQYLAPPNHHLPVRRYAHPDVFRMFEAEAAKMGFSHAACGAMVRSSYHADQQATRRDSSRRRDGHTRGISGPVTIVLIVILGVFVYPWLLARPRGLIIVAAATVALAALFVAFESGNAGFGSLRLLAPRPEPCSVLAGWIVARMQVARRPERAACRRLAEFRR